MDYVELVRRARIGDASAFGSLVEAFQDMAVGYAYSILGNRQEAEDAAQEAFLHAFRSLGSLADPLAFPAWFKRIVQSSSLALAKAGRRRPVGLGEEPRSALPGPEEELEAKALLLRLDGALAKLPPEERTAFVLYHLEEYSYREIAAFLGTSEVTVTNRLHKARKLIRKELVDMAEGNIERVKVSRNGDFKRRVLEKVGRVYYGEQEGHYEITPFPSSLRACLKAIGEERLPSNLAYARLLCASGAAFRLLWDERRWNPGNVDILVMEEDSVAPLRRAFAAAGFEAEIHGNADWERLSAARPSFSEISSRFPSPLAEAEMRSSIVRSIDAGLPVIAFGIIGPPEACIVTGYEDEGRLLLGWNFFQASASDNPEQDFDPAGYFRKRSWYEGTTGIALFGPRTCAAQKSAFDELVDILGLASRVLSSRTVDACGCERVSGQRAFASWAAAIRAGALPGPDCGGGDDEAARIMAHGDAMDMCVEGRSYAADYLAHLAAALPPERRAVAEATREAAEAFKRECGKLWEAWAIIGGPSRGPEQTAALRPQEARDRIAELILAAAAEESRAAAWIGAALTASKQ
jgi:RNA polymerase sigma factor, sigma-70 family